jgi:hypothetical protein
MKTAEKLALQCLHHLGWADRSTLSDHLTNIVGDAGYDPYNRYLKDGIEPSPYSSVTYNSVRYRLNKMEAKGYVKSKKLHSRNGPTKYYHTTPKGIEEAGITDLPTYETMEKVLEDSEWLCTDLKITYYTVEFTLWGPEQLSSDLQIWMELSRDALQPLLARWAKEGFKL